MKILLVDDASFTRLSMRKMLEQLKLDVLEAGSAEEAWTIFNEQHPELVIADQNLPEQNGLELFTKIRAVKKIPFCLMTHRPEAELINKAIGLGISHILSKPVQPADLSKIVLEYFPNLAAAVPVDVKGISVNLSASALKVALDAAKRTKMPVEAYLSKMLNQMLEPPPSSTEPEAAKAAAAH